ncbi:hypothetical protein RHECNPAF_470027 [Rhizobium etli CNPAF512]|nr:hypothetical protein RHECNPAF_470027 [Rhizobium etli CNPAF512]
MRQCLRRGSEILAHALKGLVGVEKPLHQLCLVGEISRCRFKGGRICRTTFSRRHLRPPPNCAQQMQKLYNSRAVCRRKIRDPTLSGSQTALRMRHMRRAIGCACRSRAFPFAAGDLVRRIALPMPR